MKKNENYYVSTDSIWIMYCPLSMSAQVRSVVELMQSKTGKVKGSVWNRIWQEIKYFWMSLINENAELSMQSLFRYQ